MKKYAIFLSECIGANQGGPKGYLYNLFEGFKKNGTNIELIAPLAKEDEKEKIISKRSDKKKGGIFRILLYIVKNGVKCRKCFYTVIHNYDVIHVHSSLDLFYIKVFIRYKGKIVFTPHRPEPYSKELINAYQLTFKKKDSPKILSLVADRIEVFSYKYADRFIFPSIHAKEIYNDFPGFAKYVKDKPTDYLITGTLKMDVDILRDDFRKNYHIDQDSFVIAYIGRHNSIKGYDLLSSLANRLAENDITTICAGNTEGANIPQNEKWIELGYINNTIDLMNAADVIVIPNRNTYFDLVIIEALSIGKIVITSNTGGNIDIAKDTNGIFLFSANSRDSLLNTIIEVKNLTDQEVDQREKDALNFYNKNCTIEKFADSYYRIAKNLTV